MIYDITQDLATAAVYPGDPAPQVKTVMSLDRGDSYNLSTLFLSAHTGTHLDAPAHFIAGGKTVGDLDPAAYLGLCYVARHAGDITAADAERMLDEAAATLPAAHRLMTGDITPGDITPGDVTPGGETPGGETPSDSLPRRLLIAGKAVVTADAARVFARRGLWLLGNESQTVGPEDAPMAVHLILLGADIPLLEGVVLTGVPAGWYYLVAAPLRVDAVEGAPCRAMLISLPLEG